MSGNAASTTSEQSAKKEAPVADPDAQARRKKEKREKEAAEAKKKRDEALQKEAEKKAKDEIETARKEKESKDNLAALAKELEAAKLKEDKEKANKKSADDKKSVSGKPEQEGKASDNEKASDSKKNAVLVDQVEEVQQAESNTLLTIIKFLLFGFIVYWSITEAFRIRTYAIQQYGLVIHEFDPWFNFRATQYLADHGVAKFFKWFDHESWYPFGRPVGTTIYPGMQFTSVFLFNILKWPIWKSLFGLNLEMSLNDICVYVPCWFGSIATVAIGLLTREVSGSWFAGAISSAIMAVIPAHIMRSVGGAYDNESVAMSAMCLTFFFWCRSLRTKRSWPFGIIAGLAYAYMVSSWGGYIFVGNMVGLHAGFLLFLGFYSENMYRSYTLWYLIGTSLAIQLPVVDLAPFKSMEQISTLLVFLAMQVFKACEWYYKKENPSVTDEDKIRAGVRALRLKAVGYGALLFFVLLMFLIPSGHIWALSIRVRSLFIKHTKTGNPLVDSVAEHQPADSKAYWHYLREMEYFSIVGFFSALFFCAKDAKKLYYGIQLNKWFIVLFTIVSYYFSTKMARLIILLGPAASVLSGIAVASTSSWIWDQFVMMWNKTQERKENSKKDESSKAAGEEKKESSEKEQGKKSSKHQIKEEKKSAKKIEPTSGDFLKNYKLQALDLDLSILIPAYNYVHGFYSENNIVVIARFVFAILVVLWAPWQFIGFYQYSDMHAQHVSQPSIMFMGRVGNENVMITDYDDAYKWIDANTDADARILSWWDYGYQINGIANRTTLADGNTWNIDHIGLIGKMMTGTEKNSHRLARHLADYVLIWAGNQGDDLAKSPHMVRIGNAKYPEICGDMDAMTCSQSPYAYGVYSSGKRGGSLQVGTKMKESMLYKMHSNKIEQGVYVDESLFEEVYTSKYRLVRLYKIKSVDQTSKKWLADPSNRLCDAPGSWYCPGQYPPGLIKALAEEKKEREKASGASSSSSSSDTKETKKSKRKPSQTVVAESADVEL